MSPTRSQRAVVLGAGRVGALIARDLASVEPRLSVTAVDRSAAALSALEGVWGIHTQAADLSDLAAIARIAADADVVIGAVPGALGFGTLEAVVAAGRPIVDISFMPEDPFALNEVARQRGVTAVVDCGVAPGLSNWFVGRACAELDEVDTVEILVGGLPFQRVRPHEYRAAFSPADVIEEYTRPCRIRLDGFERVVPALSGREPVELSEVGTLEAFYTDGLRTLLRTIPARTLIEKTLRYPGHAETMQALRDTGFFDRHVLEVGGCRIAPRTLSEVLLARAWALREGEEEFTALIVRVAGRAQERPARFTFRLFDRTDRASGATSMARTTGFPCAIIARMVADGLPSGPGVHPPETLGRDADRTEHLIEELARRGVVVQRTVDGGEQPAA